MWFGLATKADKQIVPWLTNYNTLFGSWKCYGSVMSPVLNPANCIMKNNLYVSHDHLLTLIRHHLLCCEEGFVDGDAFGGVAITGVRVVALLNSMHYCTKGLQMYLFASPHPAHHLVIPTRSL